MTHAVKDTAKHAAKDASETIHQVLHWDDLPPWMQIDPYIRRGYRRQLNSFHACYQSLFYPHNELVNTWSHLLPGLMYVGMLLSVDVKIFRYDLESVKVNRTDERVIQIYVVCKVICLLFSVS